MNIKELKELLADIPDDREVLIQKDSEGNGYEFLRGVDENAVHAPDQSYFGEVFDPSWTADEAGMDEEEWEEVKKNPRVVVLFP